MAELPSKLRARRFSPLQNARRCPGASDECKACPCRWARQNRNLQQEARGIPHESPFRNAGRGNSSIPEKPPPPAVRRGSCHVLRLSQPIALHPLRAAPPCFCLVRGSSRPSALPPPPAIRPGFCLVLDSSQPSAFAPDTFSSSRASHLAAWLFTTTTPDANTSLSFSLHGRLPTTSFPTSSVSPKPPTPGISGVPASATSSNSSSPRPTLNWSSEQRSSPVEKTSSAFDLVLPALDKTSSVTEDASSLSKDASSPFDNASLLNQDTSFLHEDASSLNDNASLLSKDTSSLHKDASLASDNASSFDENASSPHQNASLLRDNASSKPPKPGFWPQNPF